MLSVRKPVVVCLLTGVSLSWSEYKHKHWAIKCLVRAPRRTYWVTTGKVFVVGPKFQSHCTNPSCLPPFFSQISGVSFHPLFVSLAVRSGIPFCSGRELPGRDVRIIHVFITRKDTRIYRPFLIWGKETQSKFSQCPKLSGRCV